MDPETIWVLLEPYFKLLLAGALTIPTALNRERHTRIMGIRTFPLVGIGACAYMLISQEFIGPNNPDALARILQGLLTGIGFIGGGAILKQDDQVTGTASAASIWVTGALGAAVGLGYYNYAVSLSALNFVIIYFSPALKSELKPESTAQDSKQK